MALPTPGQSISGISQYSVVANATVGPLVGVTALNNIASNTTATFGTDGLGNETVTINGTTQTITAVGAAQSPTAFTYQSGGTTYLFSNGPVAPTNVADITAGNLTALVGGLGDTGVTAGATTYVACYLAGTMILTEFGEIAVEHLRAGVKLLTASGALRPIKWIGVRSYNRSFARENPAILPIRIKCGALADGIPTRDLYVSPAHAMLIDGALVPAGLLVNGTSIVRGELIEEIHYFHVELESHDVIIAEGAESESFVDDNSRGMFQNLAEYQALFGGDTQVAAKYCAPRRESGYWLEGVTQRLAARGRLLRQDGTTKPMGMLTGWFDELSPTRISGWAYDPDDADTPVELTIFDNGVVIANVVANIPRNDVRDAGFGSGVHGFDITIPGGLSDWSQHRIAIRRSAGLQELANSPQFLPVTAVEGHRHAA